MTFLLELESSRSGHDDGLDAQPHVSWIVGNAFGNGLTGTMGHVEAVWQ